MKSFGIRTKKASLVAVAAIAASSLLALPANAAVKGGRCSAAAEGSTATGARNTPLICAKSGSKFVWKLTTAGDGSVAGATAKSLPPAFAGTYSSTGPLGTNKGTVWFGLTEGSLASAYYNRVTVVWEAVDAKGCKGAGQYDGSAQLAAYDKLTGFHVSVAFRGDLVCADGSKVVGGFSWSTTYIKQTTTTPGVTQRDNGFGDKSLSKFPGSAAGFKGDVTTADGQTTVFEFAPSTDAARPAPKA